MANQKPLFKPSNPVSCGLKTANSQSYIVKFENRPKPGNRQSQLGYPKAQTFLSRNTSLFRRQTETICPSISATLKSPIQKLLKAQNEAAILQRANPVHSSSARTVLPI
jgi:hypothetical protein